MKKNDIKLFIYDMDGLLLDTEHFYTIASQSVLNKFGKKFDMSLKAKMMGRPAIVSAKLLIEEYNLPITPEEYLDMRKGHLSVMFKNVLPMRGAKELTSLARAKGVKQAVATSSSTELFSMKTEKYQDWFSTFDLIIKGDDPEIAHGKPAPDIFLLAAARMNEDRDRCLVFEDSLPGVTAAIAADMNVIAVPDSTIMNRDDFKKADRVLNSLEEFNIFEWVKKQGRKEAGKRRS